MRSSRDSDSTISRPDRSGICAADQAGIAALRHDRRARLGGELQDAADLVDAAGLQHQPGPAGKQAAPLVDDRARCRTLRVSAWRSPTIAAKRSIRSRAQVGTAVSMENLGASSRKSRGAAARRSRSLIASPSPSGGIGIDGDRRRAAAVERLPDRENRLAAASPRSAAGDEVAERRRRSPPPRPGCGPKPSSASPGADAHGRRGADAARGA